MPAQNGLVNLITLPIVVRAGLYRSRMLDADLVARIRERAADPKRRTDSPLPMLREPPGAFSPPITAVGLAAAEARLGFPVPAELAQLYREIAGGGFGPGDGIAPL